MEFLRSPPGTGLSGLVGPVWPLPPGAAAEAPGGQAQDSLEHQPGAHSGTLGSAFVPAAGRGRTRCRRWGCRRCAPGPGACDRAPDFLSPSGNQVLGPALGSVVTLNCTASVVSGPHCPLPSVQWLKDGLLLGNRSHYDLHEDSWVKANWSEVLVSSVLGINLTTAEDFGTFTCTIQNISSPSFILWRAGLAGHLPAVLASLLVLLVLLLAALLYVKCRLNVLLWYQDTYGEVEMNDGKLYDAYVSYSDSPEDRKFVNFILKPQLERRRGYKLFLDDRDLLPRAGTATSRPGRGRRHLPISPRVPPLFRRRPRLPRATPPGPPPPRVTAPPLFRRRPRPSESSLPPPRPCRRRCSRRAVRRPSGELEPLSAPRRGAVRRLPGPCLVQPQLPGGPVPAAGAHAQTHLYHLRGPAARPRAPRAPPAAPAPPPGDLAALEARFRGAEGGPGPRGVWVAEEGHPGPAARRRGLWGVREAEFFPYWQPHPCHCSHTLAAPRGLQTPSSDFWKELQLALPRKVQYRTMEGDPQTRLQDDKDPMLIVRGRVPEGRTLDPELDPDPEGDLGVRGPVFGELSAPPHASGVSLGESHSSEVDVSDLGSRNYSARTDFYCLVSEDDV
ncbi:single Ig IL-1-related receptor isoform X3 [Hippopotamus amphibius kiboko]|uniref:single Ig IL-1-related receptor isoform X3 n=1 Tax=Hippopotamus amphibius kiboko TaxID=575201 RepID=UPI0025991CB8|nr:single Ig IL-1-related receptor isoform X3 [Hippopotamus amphibius kiboko]